MWNEDFRDEREIVWTKIKNNKKHIINKFWDEDPGVCWWHVYIVEPDTPFAVCVWGEISPTLRRITALPDEFEDFE